MTTRKTPNIDVVRKLHFQFIEKSESPFHQETYQFKSSTNSNFVFKISVLTRDWPVFASALELGRFVKLFSVYSLAWLQRHGYGNARISYTDGYQTADSYGFDDPQRLLRQRILSDMLDPSNSTKRSMLEWRGIAVERSEHEIRLASIDFGSKG